MIHVSLRAAMKLFCPAFFAVQTAKKHHHERSKTGMLFRIGGLAGTNALDNAFGLRRRAQVSIAMIERMVGQAAASLMEIIVTSLEHVEKVIQGFDLQVRCCAEPVDPGIESFCVAHAQCLVWSKRRLHPNLEI